MLFYISIFFLLIRSYVHYRLYFLLALYVLSLFLNITSFSMSVTPLSLSFVFLYIFQYYLSNNVLGALHGLMILHTLPVSVHRSVVLAFKVGTICKPPPRPGQ